MTVVKDSVSMVSFDENQRAMTCITTAFQLTNIDAVPQTKRTLRMTMKEPILYYGHFLTDGLQNTRK